VAAGPRATAPAADRVGRHRRDQPGGRLAGRPDPELAVVLHADGQGTQGNKQATWHTLHEDLPHGQLFWGWKNFYDEDHPMLTPQQTVAEVSPTPSLISYQ
jgi:hypothetical protein